MDLRHPNLLKVENIDKMDEEISVNDILDEDDMERWSDFSIGKKNQLQFHLSSFADLPIFGNFVNSFLVWLRNKNSKLFETWFNSFCTPLPAWLYFKRKMAIIFFS